MAGLRTFALIGLLGGLSGLLAQRWGAILLVVVLAVVALPVLAGYIVTVRMHSVMGLTTAMAAITTFLVGVLAASCSTLLAAAVAVVTVALLQLKRPMLFPGGRTGFCSATPRSAMTGVRSGLRQRC